LAQLVKTKESNDEYYGLPTFQERAAGKQYFLTDMYRKDWLDNLGIGMPGGSAKNVYQGVYMSDTGYTLDEHKAILEAFTKKDPDGNNENDTTGTIGAGNFITWTLLGAYNLTDGFSVEDNGKAVYYYSTERYKEVLRYAAELYQAGYIDSEIFTVDSAQFYEKALNQYGGHFNVSVNFLGNWAQNRPPLNILRNIEGAEILITPGMIGPDGHMGSRQWAAVPVWGMGRYLYINKSVDDKKTCKNSRME